MKTKDRLAAFGLYKGADLILSMQSGISWVLVFIPLLFFAGQVQAQRTIVSGKIYDVNTNEPLPFVNVSFKDSKIGTTTDIDGLFRLETYYATDSLTASYLGYKKLSMKVKKDVEQVINFPLESSAIQMQEFTVSAKDFENPAHAILRRIIDNKKINNREKLDAYEFETYNRIEFDLNNFTKDFTEKRIFKDFDFIFDYIDSSGPKVSLPIFMTESLSDFYYKRKPKNRKEIIKATKVSGINNESISQFLGQMYQDVNIYENSIVVFEKNFISPIADYGLLFYRYYLVDSAFIGNKWCYKLDFIPKNKAELVFEGSFWVNDTTYAIKELEAELGRGANLNFISSMWVKHEYDEVEHEVWMLTREELVVDFNLREKGGGFYGRKTTTYRDFNINNPREDEFFSGADDITVETPVNSMDNEYWEQNRHEDLSDSQRGVYNMVDSLKKTPRFVTYIDIINFIFTGYTVQGPWEFGPVWSTISWNIVEGYRLRLGGRTSNEFSTRLMLESYLAYGFTDERFKYSLGGTYFLSKNPRHSVGAFYKEDLELLGQEYNLLPRDHIFTSVFRRNPQDRLTFVKEARVFTKREWFSGFTTKLELTHSNLSAEGNWDYTRPSLIDGEVESISSITTAEVGVELRFSHKEKFVEGEFERISLGSIYPIVELRYDRGFSDILEGDYDYNKLTVAITDNWPLGPFGRIEAVAEGGKLWEGLPYPLLFIHPGNETIFRNSKAFSTMNFFEFVSDEYARLMLEYHMDGLFFNKIPLLKRLNLREVVGVNGVIGRFNERNTRELILPDRTFSLNEKPYIEAFVGVENILRLLRVDFIWRFSYLDHPNVNRLAVLLGYELQF